MTDYLEEFFCKHFSWGDLVYTNEQLRTFQNDLEQAETALKATPLTEEQRLLFLRYCDLSALCAQRFAAVSFSKGVRLGAHAVRIEPLGL